MEYAISRGFAPHERSTVATLYWQAFGFKLGRVLGPDVRAKRFLCRVLDPDFALVARDEAGSILGVAGFKTQQGALVGGTYEDMRAIYGAWGGLWRGTVLSILERDLDPGILLMDGICVAENARGLGLGTALLEAIKTEACALGKSGVRLDVIDSNPRARALYIKRGFEPQKTETTGPFRYLFRFDAATQMLWRDS
ncbi:GNAT family N-acetyltransferase [uncultured Roseobacter sp.]|uniref:GNAT family N-acetyltransferase n=1 Tax=uncultured Roseobacter sp. TaxID=114847 RepID=UPI00261D8AF5|nr:GNAT family N-acetyltransferase [uncultured Roseobacter sp.]